MIECLFECMSVYTPIISSQLILSNIFVYGAWHPLNNEVSVLTFKCIIYHQYDDTLLRRHPDYDRGSYTINMGAPFVTSGTMYNINKMTKGRS